MYKNKEFDYDLFTMEGGRKYARIRNTGEVVEIDDELMKCLRAEEKKIYREHELRKLVDSINDSERIKATIFYPLSFEMYDEDEDEEPAWLIDDNNFEEDLIAKDLENKFLNMLTEHQREVFICIMKDKESQVDFANRHGITTRSLRYTIKTIRKKAKKFFE